MNVSLYRCPRCSKIVKRYHEGEPKKWIKSYCAGTGIDTHIQLVEDGRVTSAERQKNSKATVEG